MSLSLLRSGLLRRGQPSVFAGTALRFNSSSSTQPLKPVHPADVVSHHASGPPTVHETPREIAAEVVSDAPSVYPSTKSEDETKTAADPPPDELQHRQVRIFRPTKSTMQSAKGKTKRWILDWDVLQGAGRWENPLIGWASSADYMQGTQMAFRSKEDAVAFVSHSSCHDSYSS